MYDAALAELQGYFSGQNDAVQVQAITAIQDSLIDAQLKRQEHEHLNLHGTMV